MTSYYDAYAAPAFGPVRIASTRQQIDDRFPVLAFTVDTGGRPFLEVLLTTDRTLFDGANVSRRNASNFFASREHGLLRGSHEPAVYHVPSAVLQAFAKAREIFYTAIAYESESATNPAYALGPALLASSAPSVLVSPDFRGKTMASVLAVPLEKLLRVHEDAVAAPASPLVESTYEDAAWSLEADADADRVDAEDGYGESAALEEEEEEVEKEYAQSYEDDEEENEQPPLALAVDDEAYSDGFDGPIPAFDASAYGDEAAAYESAFPSDAAPPEMLEDEDERARYADEGDEAMAQSYGDESAGEYPPDYPNIQPLDAPVPQELTPQHQVRILQLIARRFESGDEGYSAIKNNGSLSWGFLPFSQKDGSLNKVLAAMQQRDPAKFTEIFGSPASLDSARLRAAGAHPAFQAAQNEIAAQLFIAPMRAFAKAMGLDSQRALAMVADRTVQLGPQGAKSWIVDAVTPLVTDALMTAALSATAMKNEGVWEPDGHAAVLAALRAMPPGKSPVPIPTREQMLDAIVRRAEAEKRPWAGRPAMLRQSTELADDVVFTL